MIRRPHLSDEHAEQLLTGRTATGSDPLVAFIGDVRAAGNAELRPSGALAAVLTGRLSADKGDLPATAASNVTGRAPQVSGRPTRRKNRMIETLLAKLAAAGLAAKVAAGASAVALAGTAAAATGHLPELPELPTQATTAVETEAEDVRQDADVRQDDGDVEEGGEPGDAPAMGDFGALVQELLAGELEGAEFGQAVAAAAQSMGEENAAEGRATGEEASEAGQANRPETTPSADDNAGTDARTEHQPVTPPPAADAGADARGDAGVQEQEDAGTQAPDDADGEADGAGAPDDAGNEGADAADAGTSRRP